MNKFQKRLSDNNLVVDFEVRIVEIEKLKEIWKKILEDSTESK